VNVDIGLGIKHTDMNHLLTAATVVLMALHSFAADTAERVPFALYAVASKDGAGVKAYEFTAALTGEAVSGLCSEIAAVTVADIDRFEVSYIELAAAPSPAFSIRFTKAGALRLQAAMRASPGVKFAVFIDGHCYSTVHSETLKTIVEGNRKLYIAVRGASNDMTMHLMELVVEKLNSKLPRP
jgi:hypothetical protein